jgi:predicted Holliday junction resolvase-like endonuclease
MRRGTGVTEEETNSVWKIIRSLKTLLLITSFLLSVVIVIVLVLEIQVQSRNKDINRVKSTLTETKEIVTRARESSDASERAINNAINQANAASANNEQLVKDIRAGLVTIQADRQTLLDVEMYLRELKGQ